MPKMLLNTIDIVSVWWGQWSVIFILTTKWSRGCAGFFFFTKEKKYHDVLNIYDPVQITFAVYHSKKKNMIDDLMQFFPVNVRVIDTGGQRGKTR